MDLDEFLYFLSSNSRRRCLSVIHLYMFQKKNCDWDVFIIKRPHYILLQKSAPNKFNINRRGKTVFCQIHELFIQIIGWEYSLYTDD